MWYMFNKWSHAEAVAIYGNDLGNHIYEKWLNSPSPLHLFADIDSECREKLVERAVKIYAK